MKKTILFSAMAMALVGDMFAQRQMESLDRGLVAVKTANGVYTSWRIPGEEWYGTTYNVYRNGSKIASDLNVSNYLDKTGTADAVYTVTAVVDGVEQPVSKAASVWKQQFLQIPLQPARSIKTGKDISHLYTVGDGTVADLDGDGEYELIIERQNLDFSFANDSAYTLWQAYKLDGTMLWEINMGPNIIDGNGAENDCMAFDFDEDGYAEVILRGTDGTTLPDGTFLGSKSVNGRPRSNDYDPNATYQCVGDEWLVMLDGRTGKTLDTQLFDSKCGTYNTSNDNAKNPARGVYEPGTSAPGNNLARRSPAFWWEGNSKAYGHRANKFYFGAPYLDGRHPSVYLGRGCYTNYHAATWDVVDKKLVLRWACAVDDNSSPFYGQGYHNFSIVDVDNDGRDEICHGNMVVDEYGHFLSSTHLGHGDAQHYGDLDPFRDGVEGFRCLEENPGAVLVDAATNEILLRWKRGTDNGRCLAGNFTDRWPGAQLWTTDGHLWSASTSRSADAVVSNSGVGLTMNARIYWDGDILEESFDYARYEGSRYLGHEGAVFKFGNSNPIFSTSGCLTINSSKGNPVVQADIFGDWREEFVLPTEDNRSVRIYTTVAETKFRNYSLMHDPLYRQGVYWQMCGYNQPPHVSYFLGNLEGITLPPPPVATNGKSLVGSTLDNATDGKHVMMCETTATSVAVSGTVSPKYLQINSPADYTLTGGTMSGRMTLLKQGQGTLTLADGTYNYIGNTEIWYGTLRTDADLTSSPLIAKRFSKIVSNGKFGDVKMEYGAVMTPAGDAQFGAVKIGRLDMDGGAVLTFDINNDGSMFDVISVDSLILQPANCIDATPVFSIQRMSSGFIAAGDYRIFTVAKGIRGDVSSISVTGLEGLSATLVQQGNDICLHVEEMRLATDIAWTGANGSIWNLDKEPNFSIGGEATTFVTGDAVLFEASAANTNVSIEENVEPKSVTFDGDKNYTLTGSGMISGNAQLVKKGSGTLTIKNANNYTGGTRIEEGTLAISKMADAQNLGAIGAFQDESDSKVNLYIGAGAVLKTVVALDNWAVTQVGDSAVVQTTGNYVWKRPVQGNRLVKQGKGSMLFDAYPVYQSLEIQDGTVNTLPEYNGQSCLGKKVILRGGTLAFANSSYTYCVSTPEWYSPEGGNVNISLDTRCAYKNKLSGSGSISLTFPGDTKCPRTYMQGDWSAFTGTIKFVCGNVGRPVILDNVYGLPKAKVNIPTADHAIQIGGDANGNDGKASGVFRIGELTGNGKLNAGYSPTSSFEVGGLNTSFTFNGSSDAILTKVGTGIMTMTNNKGVGAVIVKEGELIAKNALTSTTACAGTGALTVKDGATLQLQGYSGNSKITIEKGGCFAPGYYFTGYASRVPAIYLNDGGIMKFSLNGATDGVGRCNYFVGNSNLLLNGIISVEMNESYVPKAGDTFTLWTSRVFNASSKPTLELPELPEGLTWDTSMLLTTSGTLKVVSTDTGISHVFAYDDAVIVNVFDASGKQVAEIASTYGLAISKVAESGLNSGVYLLRIVGQDGVATRKFIKR